jgi:hypothetical protein
MQVVATGVFEMLSAAEYARAKIATAAFTDTSQLRDVAIAAGDTNVPMDTPPSGGWPDSTCVAVITAAQITQSKGVVNLYPFMVGDAACRKLSDYVKMRSVARACGLWNSFLTELIAALVDPGPIPAYLHDSASVLEATWKTIDPTIAAATSTAFGTICETAASKVAAVAAWRAAATYLTDGVEDNLRSGLGSTMLVDKAKLIGHAATAASNTLVDEAEAVLKVQKPGSMRQYTAHIHKAAAWAAFARPGDIPRLKFHVDTLNRAKTAHIPEDIRTTIIQTIAGWSSKRSI